MFSACQKNDAEQSNSLTSVNAFFDLKGFINELIDEYSEKSVTANKKVLFGDNNQYLEDLEIEWKSELQPFLQADINRLAWVEKFVVDTIKIDSTYAVSYNNMDPSIPVKLLEVSFNENQEVVEIKVKTARKNLLYTSKQTLSLAPNKKYDVEGWQKALFLRRTDFEVHGILNYD